jgi:phage gpG-like protein
MIEITGLEQIQAKLKELRALGEDTQPIMKEIGNRVKNKIEENFDEQGYYGNKWAPIKDPSSGFNGKKIGKRGKPLKQFLDYIADRRILHKSGALSRWTVNAGKTQVVVGTNAEYGIHHQYGTKKMVARPFIPMDKSGDIDPRMSIEIENYLAGKIKQITD